MNNGFLPLTKKEMTDRGWDRPDFVYISGDAYVDHPSFGMAIITRVLEAAGYKVCVIAQPDWKDEKSIDVFGEPRLGFLVSAGNMDSMVNHYYVSKKRRTKDAYTPGGVTSKRPDYATAVYANLIKRTYKNTPVILGGIEASLRRLAHYDYWSDKVRRSLLLDAQADLLLYGMGEKSVVEVADALAAGIPVSEITYVDGTVYRAKSLENVYDYLLLPSFSDITGDKLAYAKSFGVQIQNTDPFNAKRLAEPYPDGSYVVQNPPQKPLATAEMDRVYSLPYMRTYHPSYEAAGGVSAIEEVKFSLLSSRGCFGSCNFCALSFHQGRIVQSRSRKSLVEEAKAFTWEPDFKGYIHDVGGPTANFRAPACKKQLTSGACKNRQCLFPTPCEHLEVSHADYLALLRELRALPGVKKVFVRSGIRFDYLMADRDDTFFKELTAHHVSGQLKVAPEHVSDSVLKKMGKPAHGVYRRFAAKFEALNKALQKKQYLVPYLISSHPGSTLKDAVELALYLKKHGYKPEQVQDFYPTPSTVSTCMYYTGYDPRTLEKVYVASSPHEKAMQRALIQYSNPKNHGLVYEALTLAGRKDLIGFSPDCLIPPPAGKEREYDNKTGKAASFSRRGGQAEKRAPKNRTHR